MNKFNFIFKKSFWKNVLAVVIVAILCAGIIGGGIALGKYIKDKKKSPTVTWERGVISATDGKVNSDKNSIHTKDFFECRGLEIQPDLESSVTYAVAFYDVDQNFLSKTDYMSKKLTASDVPFFAQFARVEINAGYQDGEKVEIGLLKIVSYSKQVKIRVDKKQSTLASRTVNLDAENVVVMQGQGWWRDTHEFDSYNSNFYWSEGIDTSDSNILIVKVKNESVSNKVSTAAFGGAVYSGFFIKAYSPNVSFFDGSDLYLIRSDEEYSYYSLNVKDYTLVYIAVDEASSEVLEAYLFN